MANMQQVMSIHPDPPSAAGIANQSQHSFHQVKDSLTVLPKAELLVATASVMDLVHLEVQVYPCTP